MLKTAGFTLLLDKTELFEVQKQIKQFGTEAENASYKAMNSVAMDIIQDGQKNIKQNDSIATSQLLNSGRVKGDRPNLGVDAEFNTGHASVVEFGRKSGKFPPIDVILQWVKKRGLADTYSIKTQHKTRRGDAFEVRAKQAAFLIARKIAKEGTRARPFLYPAMKSNEGNFLKKIKDAIKQITG